MADKIIHPITVKMRPYPNWDRVRIAIECLLFGEFSFDGELSDVRPDDIDNVWSRSSTDG